MPAAAPTHRDPADAVVLEGVTHRYGERTALDGVTFSVSPGALFGLLGPNGGGKTTLFRILSTLVPPTEGRASVFGNDVVTGSASVRRLLSVIFQHPALDESLTVDENLRFHGALYGITGRAFRKRLDSVARLMAIDDRLGERVSRLSGGLQRRVDLARGLMHAPELMLLDEPTHGLDPVARRELWSGLSSLRRQDGTTMIVATHLLDEAERCDEVAIIHEGRIVALGSPRDLKSEIGGETLWLSTPHPQRLKDSIETQFGLSSRIVGGSLQISHPEAHVLLGPLYESLGGLIESATVRRPTLEDVFMLRTGYALDEADESVVAKEVA